MKSNLKSEEIVEPTVTLFPSPNEGLLAEQSTLAAIWETGIKIYDGCHVKNRQVEYVIDASYCRYF